MFSVAQMISGRLAWLAAPKALLGKIGELKGRLPGDMPGEPRMSLEAEKNGKIRSPVVGLAELLAAHGRDCAAFPVDEASRTQRAPTPAPQPCAHASQHIRGLVLQRHLHFVTPEAMCLDCSTGTCAHEVARSIPYGFILPARRAITLQTGHPQVQSLVRDPPTPTCQMVPWTEYKNCILGLKSTIPRPQSLTSPPRGGIAFSLNHLVFILAAVFITATSTCSQSSLMQNLSPCYCKRFGCFSA